MSGVIVTIFRITTKITIKGKTEGVKESAFIFFIVSSIFVFICVFLYFFLLKLKITKFYLRNTINEDPFHSPQSYIQMDNLQNENQENQNQQKISPKKKISPKNFIDNLKVAEKNFRRNVNINRTSVYKKISLNCWLVFFNFFVKIFFFTFFLNFLFFFFVKNTLLIFPGILSEIKSETFHLQNAWVK